MTLEGGFTAVFFRYIDLLVSIETIKLYEHEGIAKSVDTFIHEWKRVRILNYHRVELPVIDVET